MSSQLSLFSVDAPNLPVDTPTPSPDRKTVQVSVMTFCVICKGHNYIAPHSPIHPLEWMKANWKEVEPNVFYKSGYCSRECEQMAK